MNKKFPKQIPVFPLSGVIYFPKTNLPLNIFEDRYLDLVNDSFRSDKLMGMVQSKKGNSLVYKYFANPINHSAIVPVHGNPFVRYKEMDKSCKNAFILFLFLHKASMQ